MAGMIGDGAVVATPWGVQVTIEVRRGAVWALGFTRDAEPLSVTDPLATRAASTVVRYLADPTTAWQLPTAPRGTAYQQQVWRALQAIPPGETRTYSALAADLGSGARAVAAACRANPFPLLVPCHRVVGRRGLGGYMGAVDGAGVALKRQLLAHEAR